MVLVDTSVWSLALRRKPEDVNPQERLVVAEWSDLVRQGRVQLLGPIRQELLSGLRRWDQFTTLERRLSLFPDAAIETADYVEAARFFNRCREQGITGTPTDLLICAVAYRSGWRIFTLDEDFESYAKIVPIRLHRLPAREP